MASIRSTQSQDSPAARDKNKRREVASGTENGDKRDPGRSLVRYRPTVDVADVRGKGLILVVEDDPEHAVATADSLDDVGYRCHIVDSGEAALSVLDQYRYDVVLTEMLKKGGVDGIDILRRAREGNPFIAVVIFTSEATIEGAVEAMKQGAADYLQKSENLAADLEKLLPRVGNVLAVQRLEQSQYHRRRRRDSQQSPFDSVIQVSDKMARVIELCEQVAPTDATVLITGESGTGKELLAKAIHESSLRKSERFVPINCAALSPQVIESELFGHEKGSFTGASSTRKGFFEHSHKGTIFLDEVGDIPRDTQIKLLRVLENREIIRVGSNDPIPVDARVISATHRDLEEMVAEGEFREDLYYRLKVVTVHVPPLRERSQDIPVLVKYFINQYAEAYRKNFTGIQRDALAALVAHPWKGNVRELKHAVETLIVVAPGPEITHHDLPESIRQLEISSRESEATITSLVGMTIRDVERDLIKGTLDRVNGNRQEAAEMLGIGERTLYRKLKRYSLS